MTRTRAQALSQLASGLALGTALACATTPVATWEEREGSPTGAPADEAQAAPAKLTAADLARSVASAEKCLRLAESHDLKSERRGWTLLQACARRPDFVELDAVLGKPWLKRTTSTAEGPRLLAHVVAHRGGKVAQDLERIQARGVPVLSLEQALASASTPEAAQVLLRGQIVEVKGEGKDWTLVVDEADYLPELMGATEGAAKPAAKDDEDSDDSDDDGDLGGSLDDGEEAEPEPAADPDEERTLRATGRRAVLKAAALEPGVKPGLTAVLLMSYLGPQPCAGPAGKAVKACAGGVLGELLTTDAN